MLRIYHLYYLLDVSYVKYTILSIIIYYLNILFIYLYIFLKKCCKQVLNIMGLKSVTETASSDWQIFLSIEVQKYVLDMFPDPQD